MNAVSLLPDPQRPWQEARGTIWEHRVRGPETPISRPGPVIYWMQRSQRSKASLALTLAIDVANRRHVPVICYVSLGGSFPHASLRTHRFYLEGLRDLAQGLEHRQVALVVRQDDCVHGVAALAQELDAALVVTDESHLHLGRQRRHAAAALLRSGTQLWTVDNDVVVPVRMLGREHYAARTIRPHLRRAWAQHLQQPPDSVAEVDRLDARSSVNLEEIEGTLNSLSLDRSVAAAQGSPGGESAARRRLAAFVERGLPRYHLDRNNAALDGTSGLSPYLHFGQIDPWTIADAVQEARVPDAAKDAFLEELLVRRELAFNFTHYNSHYNRFSGLPGWAQRTLNDHMGDRRPYAPSPDELVCGRTADELWNAGQGELRSTGTMHGWVRMYWGKRIIEWSTDPRQALATALLLNNRYALDGRDPVSYANIAWCFGKHDRPWPRRPVFGTVRTLSRAGAGRHFDVQAYVNRFSESDL